MTSPWRLSVAPMMDWTDRHCRFFHRLLTHRTRLYTEMVTSGALLHGDVPRHLDYNEEEHPLALQLGGSELDDLARCAKLAAQWGYDEINLNCGCPSERVQRGAFGACLMAEPQLVADCVKAMRDAVGIPVTVKHRIGIDRIESYEFVRDFVGTVAAMDILAPGIGEIVGGSQREERLEKLEQKMKDMHIPVEEMSWYLDTRRFGSCPHAGFGLGFERLVQFVTGMGNIRDVIPFPRYPKSAEF